MEIPFCARSHALQSSTHRTYCILSWVHGGRALLQAWSARGDEPGVWVAAWLLAQVR